MKKVIHGSLHQATNLQLNKLSNQHILDEIETNAELKTYLDTFADHIRQSGHTPNAKEFRHFAGEQKRQGNKLPINPKQLKSRTVLYLRALKSLNKI